MKNLRTRPLVEQADSNKLVVLNNIGRLIQFQFRNIRVISLINFS